MGRSFASVRQELNGVAERWERTARHRNRAARAAGKRLAGWVKEHSSEAFFGCSGPAEAALFSVLVEVQRQRDRPDTGGNVVAGGDGDVDP
jgi:hypothetical protein